MSSPGDTERSGRVIAERADNPVGPGTGRLPGRVICCVNANGKKETCGQQTVEVIVVLV